MNESFSDHFSDHAAHYARHRPGYPEPLFSFLGELAPGRGLAWDCGTGNGQAAIGLAAHFDRVVATDASTEQLAAAEAHPRVEYRNEAAEATTLPAARVDLVTVAQAAHWFDLERFAPEVRRVAAPEGVFAAWCYRLMRVTPRIDPLLERLMFDTLEPYWPAERRHVEERFASLELPIDEIGAPTFGMRKEWTVAQALDYARTWSATRRFLADRGFDPVAAASGEIEAAWGGGIRTVAWPLDLRVGHVV